LSAARNDSPGPKRDFAYWATVVAYCIFGVPLVFTVASHVILAPLVVLKMFDPPEWVDIYLFTPLSYLGFALSVWAVWWGWKILSRQLASRAA
jgi:hypothetical protein